MRRISIVFFGLVLFFTLHTTASLQKRTPSQVHIGHVSYAINGTPGNVGLLRALEEEARIAREHATLAITDLSDLKSIQRHTRHVRYAIDASSESNGPSNGYGVLRAATGVKTHIELAAKSEGASEEINLHAAHVSASAANVTGWSLDIVAESKKVLKAETAKDANLSARKIAELTVHILEGADANNDGRIGWVAGEGGIAQMKLHMEILFGVAGENR